MIFQVTSDRDIEDIKNSVATEAKKMGFGVLKDYKFQEILKEKGYPIEKDITIFELCNPKAAQLVLSSYPEMAVYLPCRLSIYEIGEKTLISTIEFEDIMDSFNIANEFKLHMKEVFENLKNLMNNLKS